jgi:hypothetical protein
MSYDEKIKGNNQHIYLNIDHLKKGEYIFNFMLENKVCKTVKIKKNKGI